MLKLVKEKVFMKMSDKYYCHHGISSFRKKRTVSLGNFDIF